MHVVYSESKLSLYLFTSYGLWWCNFVSLTYWDAVLILPLDYLVLEDHVSTYIGKLAIQYYLPQKWNNLQKLFKPDKLIAFNQFKSLLIDIEWYRMNEHVLFEFMWSLMLLSLVNWLLNLLISFLFIVYLGRTGHNT